MKKISYNSGTSQLGWAVLLLFAVMVLPTLGLIWFMTAAIRNEHLAVRQKYIDYYENIIDQEVSKSNNKISEDQKISIISSIDEYPDFINNSFWLINDILNKQLEAVIILDTEDNIIWPIAEPDDHIDEAAVDIFTAGWHYEYADNNPEAALKEYEKVAAVTTDLRTVTKADISIARILSRTGEIDKAIERCLETAYPKTQSYTDLIVISDLIAKSRVMLTDLQRQKSSEIPLESILTVLGNYDYDNKNNISRAPKSSESRIWMIETLLATPDFVWDEVPVEVSTADRTMKFEEESLKLAESISDVDFSNWTENKLRRIDGDYYSNISIEGYKLLCKHDYNKIQDELYAANIASLNDETVFARLIDDSGNNVFLIDSDGSAPLLVDSPGKHMPGWKLEVYLKDSAFFDSAAGRQSALYAWGGVLIILLVIVCGIVLSISIGRQYRLNRLKNSFVATVTHELKTPLSSMRLLVDTLLEGNYRDQDQAKEYLELISKENVRLSRLIDNFLTFSRMERNKHSFVIEKTDAVKIAREAVDAVHGRFEHAGVEFSADIPESVLSIAADSDAMVTVLVNLLDNAFKYTPDDKKIGLSLYAQDSLVCFRVKDNGIGMTPRVQKKIFDRFYQADQHLTRISEGCGLGLSIVKFIVDAHDGRITVDSNINQGSIFTIKIPLSQKG